MDDGSSLPQDEPRTPRQRSAEQLLWSSQLLMEGCMNMSQAMAKSAQAHLDHSVSAWSALAQTPPRLEPVERQTELLRAALDEAIEQMNRLADAWMQVVEQTMAPISAPSVSNPVVLPMVRRRRT